MNKQDFTLFWAIAPSEDDWTNLIISGVSRVMLTYQLARARPEVLGRLAGLRKRVVIRVEQDNQEQSFQIAQTLGSIMRVLPVDAVIVGNEPESGIDLSYASPDWQLQRAYASLPRISALIAAVHGLGLQAVSPAFSEPPDAISEDGELLPGRTSWREVCARVYDTADGCGGHLYSLDWRTEVDILRFKFGLKWLLEHWHRPIWIDEVGVIQQSDIGKMAACVTMANIVMAHKANERVMMLCPFISAGDPGTDPPAWDRRYLIKDQRAYELLGAWMQQ